MELPQNIEQPKPKIYLPEVGEIILSDPTGFLKKCEKELAAEPDKKETLHHSQRIANLGCLLAKERGMTDQETRFFVEACLLHDIGKIKIPDKYLTKKSENFTEKDFNVIKMHPEWGYKYLKSEGRSPYSYLPALLHHEFQDERSYPPTQRLLKKLGDIEEDADIDIIIDNSRLLAILDVFDTYAFGRPYVNIKPKTLDEGEEMLNKQFKEPGEREIISFLKSKYETIRKLGI